MMLQAFVPEVGKVEYRDVAVPALTPDDVLIRVTRVGICGSDQHVFHGHHPIVQPPLVQGHEFAGIVEAIGSQVTRVAPGDLVSVQPAGGCGRCANCLAGLPGQCPELQFIGGRVPGAMSTFIAVAQRQVYSFPAAVDHEDAAMAEPLAVAVRAVNMAGPLQGGAVLVAGGGTIGQLVARVALAKGAGMVVLSDPNPHRRACAEIAGCRTIDPIAAGDFAQSVRELAGGQAISTSIECVGSSPALANCLQVLARRSMLIVCGVFAKTATIDMVKVQDQEIAIHGSLMYSWSEFAEAVELIGAGRIELKSVQTHHVPFREILAGYSLLDRPNTEAIKVFVDIA